MRRTCETVCINIFDFCFRFFRDFCLSIFLFRIFKVFSIFNFPQKKIYFCYTPDVYVMCVFLCVSRVKTITYEIEPYNKLALLTYWSMEVQKNSSERHERQISYRTHILAAWSRALALSLVFLNISLPNKLLSDNPMCSPHRVKKDGRKPFTTNKLV